MIFKNKRMNKIINKSLMLILEFKKKVPYYFYQEQKNTMGCTWINHRSIQSPIKDLYHRKKRAFRTWGKQQTRRSHPKLLSMRTQKVRERLSRKKARVRRSLPSRLSRRIKEPKEHPYRKRTPYYTILVIMPPTKRLLQKSVLLPQKKTAIKINHFIPKMILKIKKFKI